MQVNCTFCRMKNVCMSSWLTHCIGTLAFVQFITKSLCKLNLRIWIHLGVHNCKNTICRKFQICNNWQICNLEQIAELQTCKFAGHKLDLQKISVLFQASRFAYLQNCNLSKTFQNVHSNAGVSSGKAFLVYRTKCTYLQSAPAS